MRSGRPCRLDDRAVDAVADGVGDLHDVALDTGTEVEHGVPWRRSASGWRSPDSTKPQTDDPATRGPSDQHPTKEQTRMSLVRVPNFSVSLDGFGDRKSTRLNSSH